MHVGALHVYVLPAGYKGRFVRDLRRHIAARLADRAGAATQAVVDAAEPGQPGVGRQRAGPEPAHRRDQAAEGGAHRRRPGAARGAGGGAASGAARSQAAAVEVPRLRRPGARRTGHKRVAMYSQLHHAAVDGQAAVALANAILDVTPEPRAIELRAEAHARRSGSAWARSLRGAMASQIAAGGPHRQGTACHGGHARRRGRQRAAGRAGQQQAVRRQGRRGQPRAGAEHARSTPR